MKGDRTKSKTAKSISSVLQSQKPQKNQQLNAPSLVEERHKIAIGTYDKALHGFDLVRDPSTRALSLEPIFGYASAHTGCIKTIAINSKGMMVTGSTDESLRTYDLNAQLEMDSFPLNEGTINVCKTWKNMLCLAGNEDGGLTVWDTSSPAMDILLDLEGHKLGINSIAIHPTGKLALTTSKDLTMRVWNLSNGTCRLCHQLDFEAEFVVWNTTGTHYALSGFDAIRVYNLEGEKLCQIEAPEMKHILAMTFLSENLLATGGEDRAITVWDINTQREEYLFEGFQNRVKAMDIIVENKKTLPLLVAISTDGTLKVFDVASGARDAACETNLSGRLVCLATQTLKSKVRTKEQLLARKEKKANLRKRRVQENEEALQAEVAKKKRKTQGESKEENAEKLKKKKVGAVDESASKEEVMAVAAKPHNEQKPKKKQSHEVKSNSINSNNSNASNGPVANISKSASQSKKNKKGGELNSNKT